MAQRYPADYDGTAANVPIVDLSSMMLAPELTRIQEKPLANRVTPAKVNAICGKFMRQCDKLDGPVDGIINNYMACRAIIDRTQAPCSRVKQNPNNRSRAPVVHRTVSLFFTGPVDSRTTKIGTLPKIKKQGQKSDLCLIF